MADIPHLKWPLQLTGTRFKTFEEDSPEEVQQCVINLLRTPVGFSDEEELVDMGLTQQEFKRGGPDLGEIEHQVMRFEPRTDPTLTDDRTDLLDDAFREIGVRLATQPLGEE